MEALVQDLRRRLADRAIVRVDIAAFSALKTYDPPLSALHGTLVDDVTRHGKFLDIDASGLHLVIHLSRAGWIRWRDDGAGDAAAAEQQVAARRPGRPRRRLRARHHRGRHEEAAGDVRRPRPARGARASSGSAPTRSPTSSRSTCSSRSCASAGRSQIKGVLRSQSIDRRHRQRLLRRAAARRADVAVQAGGLGRRGARGAADAVRRDPRRPGATPSTARRGWPPPSSRARRSRTSRCTGGPARSARCAATPCARCRSPTRRCSTARPARPAASRSPTGGCPSCSSADGSRCRLSARAPAAGPGGRPGAAADVRAPAAARHDPERREVRGPPLDVEQPPVGVLVGQQLDQPDQRHLGRVGHPVEHRLAREQPADRDAVQPADELAVDPASRPSAPSRAGAARRTPPTIRSSIHPPSRAGPRRPATTSSKAVSTRTSIAPARLRQRAGDPRAGRAGGPRGRAATTSSSAPAPAPSRHREASRPVGRQQRARLPGPRPGPRGRRATSAVLARGR